MSRITPLPPQTRSILRSTIILPSLVSLVSELIQNSLDANASNLEINIDCEEWSCSVQDDGGGISKDDLDVIANTDQPGTSSRYSTSKTHGTSNAYPTTLGFRGEALASIADLSILEISSRTARSRQSWAVILKGQQNLYTGPSVRWKRESHGTTVCVRDAFHNLPIRRRSHPSPTRTLELIRREIETYALVFPTVSFTLRQSRTHDRLLAVPKTPSTLNTFRHLFGRALVQHVQEINETQGGLKLNGFISLNGAPSKIYQFLYINRRHLSICDLHRIIDNKFASSTFAKHAYDESGEAHGLQSIVRRFPRRGEKKPVYVLNMTIPSKNVDNCMDPAKTIIQNDQTVSTFLSGVIQDFLITHRFSSQQGGCRLQPNRGTAAEEIAPPPKRRKVTYDQPTLPVSRESGSDDDGHLNYSDAGLYVCNDTGSAERLTWADPATGEVFVVNSKTGHSYPPMSGRDVELCGGTINGHPTIMTRRTLLYAPGHPIETEPVPEWIQAALQENDVYPLTEPAIPALELSSVFTADMQRYELQRMLIKSKHGYCHHSTYGGRSTTPRFVREDLAQATILGQVDQKFIACITDNHSEERTHEASASPSKSLFLIDQHAADERIRVERFLQELCSGFFQHEHSGGGVKVAVLDPAIPILLTRHEVLTLKRSSDVQDAFAKWGFTFDELATVGEDLVDRSDENGGYIQILVRTVPDIVSNKLLRSDDLREMVKRYLADLATDVPANLQSQSNEHTEEFSWQKAVRQCPSQLLDMVNSKACRGAIMFNDPLSMQQCQKLVQQLSKTAFPFRCAHGRPSIVPLFNFESAPSRSNIPRLIDWENFERSVT